MTVQIVHRSFRTNLLDRANENKSYANTFIKHLYISNTDATDGADEPEVVQINLRLSKAFLEDIDTTWKQEGFNSRSEFLRHVARNAVKHPEFTRQGWKKIATSEHALRTGDADLVPREELVESTHESDDG